MADVGFALLLLGLIMVGRIDAQSSVPAILIFGDSTVDTGNNNYVNNAPRANFSPYGRDYPGGVPTGRFSDGRLSIDYIASALGLKETVPPYLNPNLTPRDLATGVTFASTASGYDPETSNSGSALTMTQQLSYFRQYQSRLTAALGAAQTQRIVNQALYLVSSGSADLAVSYFYNPFTRGGGRRAAQYPNVNDYIDFLIRQAVSFFTQLHGLGARRIMVSGLSILGCTPLQRTYLAIEGRPCNERINQAALVFNRRLSAALANLQSQLGDVRFLFSDTYEILLDATVNPLRYGFVEVSRGCCGSGLVEVGTACGAARLSCPDAGRFVYFDSVHPSQHMYQLIAQQMIQNDIPRLV